MISHKYATFYYFKSDHGGRFVEHQVRAKLDRNSIPVCTCDSEVAAERKALELNLATTKGA